MAGARERATGKVAAQVVASINRPTIQNFVANTVDSTANVFTDELQSYRGIPQVHKVVNHSVKEYVRDRAHTNGIESFWAMLKRGYHGTYHQWSAKHLDRYVTEFAGRNNNRSLDTIDQMASMAQRMVGKQLQYQNLIQG